MAKNIGDFSGDTAGQIEVIRSEYNNPKYAADRPALARELARLGAPITADAPPEGIPIDSPEAQALIAQSSGAKGALSAVAEAAPAPAPQPQTGPLSRVAPPHQQVDIAEMLQKFVPQDDSSARYLAMAAALGKPTEFGSFGEKMSNVAGALAQQKQEQQKLRAQYAPLIMQQVAAQQAREEQNAYRLEAQQQAQMAQQAAALQAQQARAEQAKIAQDAAAERNRESLRSHESVAAERAHALQIAREQGAKAPAGYAWGPNDANGQPTMLAVKGGPADLKMTGALNADTQALTGSVASFDRLAAAANEVLSHPGVNGITGLRGKLPNIPGSDAANAEALLGTLKSQVGFGVLQDMRNNSKTGGALGSVSDAEGKRLESNLAALDKSQSVEQFKANLAKIVDYADKAKDRMREAYNLKHGDQAPSQPQVATTNAPVGMPSADAIAAEMARRAKLKGQ